MDSTYLSRVNESTQQNRDTIGEGSVTSTPFSKTHLEAIIRYAVFIYIFYG